MHLLTKEPFFLKKIRRSLGLYIVSRKKMNITGRKRKLRISMAGCSLVVSPFGSSCTESRCRKDLVALLQTTLACLYWTHNHFGCMNI